MYLKIINNELAVNNKYLKGITLYIINSLKKNNLPIVISCIRNNVPNTIIKLPVIDNMFSSLFILMSYLSSCFNISINSLGSFISNDSMCFLSKAFFISLLLEVVKNFLTFSIIPSDFNSAFTSFL